MNGNHPMSDHDVLRAVGDSLSGMPAAQPPPIEVIKARGRARQRRRAIPGIAGALAVAAGAVVAVTALAPASPQPHAQLAAWTVVKQADGEITVTIRELSDPAGLQSTLRADDVPASVSVAGNPSCRGYPSSGGTPAERRAALSAALKPVIHVQPLTKLSPQATVLVIHPSALPGGIGLEITASVQPEAIGVGLGLVHASQQCTGS